jgi:hypothetical protein
MLATNEIRQTGNVLLLCVCAKTVGVEMERLDTGREGALDVEPAIPTPAGATRFARVGR